jgi:hypothetical protein
MATAVAAGIIGNGAFVGEFLGFFYCFLSYDGNRVGMISSTGSDISLAEDGAGEGFIVPEGTA